MVFKFNAVDSNGFKKKKDWRNTKLFNIYAVLQLWPVKQLTPVYKVPTVQTGSIFLDHNRTDIWLLGPFTTSSRNLAVTVVYHSLKVVILKWKTKPKTQLHSTVVRVCVCCVCLIQADMRQPFVESVYLGARSPLEFTQPQTDRGRVGSLASPSVH